MGNQQAAFYYGLNYDATNDSGFFDDEVFGENEEKKKQVNTAVIPVENSVVENVESSKVDRIINSKQSLKGNKASFTKSRSIEIVQNKENNNTMTTTKSRPILVKRQNNPLASEDINEINEDSFEKHKKTLPMSILKQKHTNQTHLSALSVILG